MTPVLALDWNGTLVADIDRAAYATATVLDRHEIPHWDIGSFRTRFRLPLADFFTDLGMPAHRLADAIDQWNTDVAGMAPIPSPGATGLLHRAQADGWTIAVVTAASLQLIEQDLNQLGWVDLVDRIHADVTHKSAVLRELPEIGPVNYVGDTEYDVVEVARAGATAISYTSGYRPAAALLSAGPAATADHLDDVVPLLDRMLPCLP